MFDDHEISYCENYEHLGLHDDKKLNFVKHILKIVAKLAQHCGALEKLTETQNKGHLVQYFRYYLSPRVHYGVPLYGLGAKTKLQKILRIQKKFRSDCLTASPLGQRSRNYQ